MREYLYQIIESQNDLSAKQIIMNIAMAALIGFAIYISYYISHIGTIYSKKFNVSLVMLTILTGTVMTVIGNNIALSLGMVGALSIVRFRTAIKDTRDTMYIFWAIIIGICCGVGDYIVAAVGSAIVFVLLLVLGAIKSEKRMLLIIRGNRSLQSDIQSLVFKTFSRKASLRVKNSTKDNIEYIYEISDRVLKQAEQKNPDIINSFYQLGDIEYVNIVLQNDEVSG